MGYTLDIIIQKLILQLYFEVSQIVKQHLVLLYNACLELWGKKK